MIRGASDLCVPERRILSLVSEAHEPDTSRLSEVHRRHRPACIASSDLVGELIAQSPKGNPLDLDVQGARRHRARRSEDASAAPTPTSASRAASAAASTPAAAAIRDARRRRLRRRRRGGARRRRGGGGGARAGGRPRRGRLRRPRDPQRRLGLRQQPDRHRGRDPAHHADRRRGRQGERRREEDRRQARAGAGLHRVLGDAGEEGSRRRSRSEDKQALRPEGRRRRRCKNKGVSSVTASVGITNEWRYFASSEGSYIEQETFEITPTLQRHRRKVGDVTKTRSFVGVPKTGGWEVAEEPRDARERRAHRRRSGRDDHREADRHGAQGSRR